MARCGYWYNRLSCIAELENEAIDTGYLEVAFGMGQLGKPLLAEATIAYIVDAHHWGKGFGASTARGLMDSAFGSLGVRRVTATCNADNPASVRILEGLGMRREQHGVADSWHDELGWIDGFQYAILKRSGLADRQMMPSALAEVLGENYEVGCEGLEPPTR